MLTNIGSVGFIQALIIFLVVIFSVSVHEFTHAFIAYLKGDSTARDHGRLTINPLAHFETIGFVMMLVTNFGWGKPVPIDPRNLKNPGKDSLLIACAGPLSNLILALAAAGILDLLFNLNIGLATSLGGIILLYMVIINIGLGVFNLLPFPPLDGSNIYRMFLPLKWQYKIAAMSWEYMIILFLLAFIPIINGQSIISFVLSPVITSVGHLLVPQAL